MVHGKNRIPYRIDRRLTGLAGPDYAATISFGLPYEPEDSQYGESRAILYLIQSLSLIVISASVAAGIEVKDNKGDTFWSKGSLSW